MGRLVIDGNSVYEIDEACIQRKEEKEGQARMREDRRNKKGEWHQPKRER